MTDAETTTTTRERASELWIRSGFDNAAVGLAIIDASARHILVNPAYVEQTGRTKSSLLGEPISDVLAARSRHLLATWAQDRHQPTTIEVALERADGGVYDAALFLTPMDTRDARDHTLVQVVGVDSAPSTRDSAARLRAIVDHIDELVFMTRADGALTYVSPSVERASGSQTSDLVGTPLIDLVHPDDHDAMAERSRTGTDDADVVVRLRTSSGWRDHAVRVSEVRDQLGHLLGLAYLARPRAVISDDSPTTSAGGPRPGTTTGSSTEPSDAAGDKPPIESLEGWRTSTPDESRDIVWHFDHEGPVFANAAARTMIGIEPGESLQGLGLGNIHPQWAVERIARHGVPQTLAGVAWDAELAVLDADGNEIAVTFVLTAHRDAADTVTHWSAVSQPASEEPAPAPTDTVVLRDPLTGLPGPALLHDRIEVALARGTRTGQRVGVLMLDLDFFGSLQSSVGSGIASDLLAAMAERLSASVRPGDTVARVGEDEFVVLCEHFERVEDAEGFAQRLLREVEDPVRAAGAEWYLSMSIGVSLARQGAVDPAGLLSNAETAMYRAKELGRGRHVVFDTAEVGPGSTPPAID